MGDGCLLVLARDDDPAVRMFQQQASSRVAHASIADLSRAGWSYETGRPECASACAAGRMIPADEITALVCRIDAVFPNDLSHVHRDDRSYVAAEMNAFLFAWLMQFTGVRFNAPSWASLAGPAWHSLQWTWLAASVGVPVATPAEERGATTVTVVGEEVFGITDRTLTDYSLRIARAVDSTLLSVTFVRDGDWKFQSADPCPVLDAVTTAAVLDRAFAPLSSEALCGVA